MSENNNKFSFIIVAICVTLVFLAAIGSWVYVENKKSAQLERQLQQDKLLREKEIEVQENASKSDLDARRREAQAECQASGRSWFEC